MFAEKRFTMLFFTVFRSKGSKVMGFLAAIALVAFIFKTDILQSFGNFLIDEDKESFASETFVLGGNSYDRGMKALDLYNQQLTEHITCTGGNIPSVLEAIDTALYEADITRILLQKNGVPPSKITALTNSTSTLEECDEIFRYCQENNIKHANILSSKFHLRRVRYVFEDKFKSQGIKLHFIGAPSSKYQESAWWKSEQGMIMVNNEYMKLIYYWMR